MISILILTLNEENNLPACLESVRWSDDIHVLDSYSSDKTVEIAKSVGAHVWFRKFDSFAQHQNWALENIAFKNPWVFYLDADERVMPELADAMLKAVQNNGPYVAFKVQRRDFFMGTWLKHVQMTAYYDRLFQPGRCATSDSGTAYPIQTARSEASAAILIISPSAKGCRTGSIGIISIARRRRSRSF